jgi:hypothetical protein
MRGTGLPTTFERKKQLALQKHCMRRLKRSRLAAAVNGIAKKYWLCNLFTRIVKSLKITMHM